MKVLICGGSKTQNIVDGLHKKFASGGIEFLVVPYITDIEEIFNRGEYYDRALIIEPSWTEEYTDTDARSIRVRVNDFAQVAESKGTKGLNYVFLSQTYEMADLVSEEILQIESVSINIIKAPRYSVNFFASLVSMSFEQFPDSIIYKPKIEIPEEYENIEVQEFTDIEDTYESVEIDDISSELFSEDVSSAPGLSDYSNGVDVIIHQEKINEQGDINDTEEISDSDFDSLFEELGDIEEFTGESIEETEEINVDRESGTLPEFTCSIEEDLNIGETESNPEYVEDEDILVDEHHDYSVDEQVYMTEYANTEEQRESGDIPSFDDIYKEDIEEMAYEKADDIHSFESSVYSEKSEISKDESNTQESKPDRFTIEVNKHNNTYEQDSAFDEKYYEEDSKEIEEEVAIPKIDTGNTDYVKSTLDAFASRGNSIVVTGCGGCGTSTVAYNLANTICNIGYNVLLVDMDTENRAQSFISKNNYDCVELDGANLMQALKSSSGINTFVSIVKPGFKLLTMGLGGDIVKLDKMIQPQKLARFINSAKTNHDFVIYDLPFKDAVGCASDVTFMADNLVIVSDCSNWGATKTLSCIGNIENEDIQDIVYSRGQLIFNRVKPKTKKILGRKVKSLADVQTCMDRKITDLLGEEPIYKFGDMHMCGAVGELQCLEDYWYNTKQYSDTQEGYKLFTELLIKIVLRR